jgi:hypothetical protein
MIDELDPKDPDSIEVFNWNFEPTLAPGDAVAAVDGISFPETDGALAQIGLSAIDDAGLVVSAKLGTCTRGQYYTARCRVTTTLGETLDLSLRFYCDEN